MFSLLFLVSNDFCATLETCITYCIGAVVACKRSTMLFRLNNLLRATWDQGFDWFDLGSWPRGPDALRPYKGALCAPNRNHGSPVALLKPQMAPRPMLLMSPGSKKEPRYACLSEAQASHSHRTWAEVSSFMPHPLHTRLFASPSKRCLLRVLYPVRKPVTTLDWVLLRDKNFALLLRLGPDEIRGNNRIIEKRLGTLST
jgi:hypothetical protein